MEEGKSHFKNEINVVCRKLCLKKQIDRLLSFLYVH